MGRTALTTASLLMPAYARFNWGMGHLGMGKEGWTR